MTVVPPPADGEEEARRFRHRRGTLAAWAVVLLWGFHYVVLYRPLRLIDPERYLALRFGWAGGTVLVLCLFLPVVRGLSGALWGRLFLVALVGIVGYQWVFLQAASILDPVPLVMILSLGPVLVALYSQIRGHESFSFLEWGAIGLVVLGIVLVVRGGVTGDPARTGRPETLEGLLMAALSLLFFTGATLMSRSLLARVSPLQATLVPILIGALILIPLHPSWIVLPAEDRTPLIVGSLLYSVFAALFLSYFLWNLAVASLGPTRASLWVNGQPIVTAAGSVIFLGAHFSGLQVGGGVLAIAGFWLFFGTALRTKSS